MGRRHHRYVSGVVCGARGEEHRWLRGRYRDLGRYCVYVRDVPADALVGVEDGGAVILLGGIGMRKDVKFFLKKENVGEAEGEWE